MDIKQCFEALAKSATVDVSVPKGDDIDACALIRNGQSDDLARIPARRHLFFDEEASLLVVLKTAIDEDAVRELSPHLELVLTAHATDAVPQGSGNTASASGKHDLSSASYSAGDGEVKVIADHDKTYMIWRPTLHLSRPRARLQRPAIYFTANLKIQGRGNTSGRRLQTETLKSYEPLPANVLEPLLSDPALRGSQIYLPESRITKVAPKAPSLQDAVKPIRGASKRAFPAVPALFSRIRYSPLPDSILASLHLETSQIIAGTVTVSKVHLEVPHAEVQHLTDIALPLTTRAGDETVVLYKLIALDAEKTSAAGETTPVSITIGAEAILDQGSRITMNISWQTQVDLHHKSSKPVYKWSRPLSTSLSHHRGLSTQSSPDHGSTDTGPKHADGEGGVAFTFVGPDIVCVREEFVLQVYCKNKSLRPRRFALLMLNSRKTRTTTTSQVSKTAPDLIAAIFGAPPLEASNTLSVLDVNPDFRIGPLAPRACYETTMKFRALRTGVLDLGALRIIDLDTRQTVDVKELPDIVALDAEDAEAQNLE